LLQTDNHASTPPLSFLQAGCPSCRPTNSIKALKASVLEVTFIFIYWYDTLILTILHYTTLPCQHTMSKWLDTANSESGLHHAVNN